MNWKELVDIPSILYGSLKPKPSPLYDSLKYDREVVKANYNSGLIDLDGYMGKVGALSLNTGRFKYMADKEDDKLSKKSKTPRSLNNPIPGKAKSKSSRGRPAKNIVERARELPPILGHSTTIGESTTTNTMPVSVSSLASSEPATTSSSLLS